MSTTLLIRPRGAGARALLASGSTYIETSVEDLQGRSWLLGDIETSHLGVVILEDMRFEDLEDEVRVAITRAAAGHSCPVVTRWTQPRSGDAR